jgi:hypothetical protein
VRTLVTLPHATVPVAESERTDIREMYVGSYRIIFRVGESIVEVLGVVHGARLLSDKRFDETE